MRALLRLLCCLAPAGLFVAPASAALSPYPPSLFAAWVGDDGEGGGHSTAYRDGQRELDAGNWKEAAKAFRQLASQKGDEADAALYWLAYALAKDERQADALAAVRELRAAYPKSKWLDDAQALELEMRGPRAPVPGGSDAESEELKLYALNGLMQVDSARAIPVLRKFLQGNSSPRLKKKALFVLGQSGAPEARQLLVDVARGRQYPTLQEEAIQMLGVAGGRESVAALGEIYRESQSREVKEAVLSAYLVCNAREAMLAVAQGDKDASMRGEAIGRLGAMGAKKELRDLYAQASSRELRSDVLHAMGVAGDAEGLAQVARSERDPELREDAIHSMGITGGAAAAAALKQIYLDNADAKTKEAVIHALFIQGNARVLIELFRAERDRGLRREIVHKLSLMNNDEATELLLKMLED